ncbi:SPFH domain-containing protein [Leptospira ilyithenensis]|uniref:SPFH domain-containing protein n=1 Tax=Leptospira ilyithenensis TaxID=2484901 RepID=A0A4R9LRR9_9LEPT|nr:SPFH domain-containing protein [Leptospira ilyithenensis]TGN11082.1 SPFH domain-containing protein [Leptospira ilyithenensis]
MALIDRIKFEGKPNEIVWKYPSDEISTAGQLIVDEGLEAVFFKEGKALDTFGSGTHTLKTGNIPILEALVNLPFGGKTPFTAEVYYINKGIFAMKWGTNTPIPLEDPKYKIVLNIRAFGDYKFRIKDSKPFLINVVKAGNRTTNEAIDEFLKPNIVRSIGDFISEVILNNNTSVVEINKYRDESSTAGRVKLSPEFEKYGIELTEFNVSSVNFDQQDPNYQRIQKIITDKFEIDMLGDKYQQKKMFDIGQASAENQGQAGGAMGAGMGMGMGMNMGQMMGNMMNQNSQNQGQSAPAANDPAVRIAKLKGLLDQGLISAEEFETKKKEILSSI